MGELGFTMWMELSSPPIPPTELNFLCLIISILWISLQYFLFWKHEGLCCNDSRVCEQSVYLEGSEHVGSIQAHPHSVAKANGELLEAVSDFEHDPGLWNVLNPHSAKEETTDHVAPRSPY